MGSGTVGGTLMTAVLLRLLNITTVLLLLLWAMSPLGGQGALRMLYTKTVPITRSSVTVWYLNSDTEPWVSSASGMGKVLPRVDAIFMSAILAPDDARSGPVDIYGKIKIPRIETMETSDTPEDGWFTVNPAKVRFSSLVGAPFQMFPKANASGNGSFNMETSYFHFDCEKIDKLSKRMVPRPALAALLSKGPNGMSRSMLLNDTEATYTSSRTASRKGVLEPRRLEFLSTMGSGFDEAINETSRHFAYTQCSMTTTFVESRVACVDQRCEVVAVRRSRRPHEPEHLTVLDGAGIAISANFYSRFSISGATGSGDQYTPAQHYLANTENSMSVSENLRIVPDIAAIDKTTFSERLGVLFNTYWTIFQAPHSITTTPQKIAIADTPADKPLIPQGQAPTLPGHMKTANSSAPFLAEKAPAEFVRYEEQYACTWYWLTCFGLSALVLTIISIIGVICQFLRIAPDIFYISGLTRDTPYVNVEGQGAMSTLDGSYKARPLRNMRVVIADVKPDEKVGKVALIAVDERMGEKVDRWEKLRWKRRYQ